TVRRPVVLMADVLAGRAVDVDRTVVPTKDGCPAKFRPLRDDYLASCRRRGNAEASVVAKDRAASRFLAYLVEVGVDDLAALGVRDVSGFLLRQRGLRRKAVASLRSCHRQTRLRDDPDDRPAGVAGLGSARPG